MNYANVKLIWASVRLHVELSIEHFVVVHLFAISIRLEINDSHCGRTICDRKKCVFIEFATLDRVFEFSIRVCVCAYSIT